MSSQVLALRELLEQRFPDAVPVTPRTAGAVGTGIGALDRLLPGGGLPRGRLTAWRPGGGVTAVLRAACLAVAEADERAAWVDGRGLLVEHSLPGGSSFGGGGPLLLRAGGGVEALECAEELLRSGGFGLVVLAGAKEAVEQAVRLSRAAREGGAAFVLVAGEVPVAALRLASRIEPGSYRWGAGPFGEAADAEEVLVEVEAASLGWSGRTEFALPVLHHEYRLSLEPGLVDRRGSPGVSG